MLSAPESVGWGVLEMQFDVGVGFNYADRLAPPDRVFFTKRTRSRVPVRLRARSDTLRAWPRTPFNIQLRKISRPELISETAVEICSGSDAEGLRSDQSRAWA
jgi:hypothetical protein